MFKAQRLVPHIFGVLMFASTILRAQQPATRPWQTDFAAFVTELQKCIDSNCPTATFKGIEVAWEGTVVEVNRTKQVFRVAASVPQATVVVRGARLSITCCNLNGDTSPSDTSIRVGMKVRFYSALHEAIPIAFQGSEALVVLSDHALIPADRPLEPRRQLWAIGRVVGADGAAAIGAQVRVHFDSVSLFAPRATTDSTGSFSLQLRRNAGDATSRTLTAEWTSTARSSSGSPPMKFFAVADGLDDGESKTLTLAAAGTLEVTVLDPAGKAGKDVWVNLESVDGRRVRSFTSERTSGDGRATLVVPAGRLVFRAEHQRGKTFDWIGALRVDVATGTRQSAQLALTLVK